MSDMILTKDERHLLETHLSTLRIQVRAGPMLDPGTIEECVADGMSQAEAEEYVAEFPARGYESYQRAELWASALGKAVACVYMWESLSAEMEDEDE